MDRVPRQRLLLFASWIVTTMVATLVSAAGVSLVTRDVTDSHTPALRSTDVVALLAAPTRATTPPATAPPTVIPTTTPAAMPVVAPTPAASDGTAPEIADPPTTARPAGADAPWAPPLGDARAQTYWSRGGAVTVGCLGATIALVSAWSNDGFRFVVEQDGPELVQVRFEADGDRDGLLAGCRDGGPVLASGGERGEDGIGDAPDGPRRERGGHDGGPGEDGHHHDG
jgi:hypothetical protein